MRRESREGRDSSVDLLQWAALGVSSYVEGVLKERGLTMDQWRVLRALVGDGPQTMTALGVSTRITGPTLTRVVDRLAESALVYRNVDAEDRRRVVVHAAQRGTALVRSLSPLIIQAEHAGLSALTDQERRTLRRLLERLDQPASS